MSNPIRLYAELRAIPRAIEHLLEAPVSHTSLRVFCRSLDAVASLAQELTREEDVPFGFDLSIEDARDVLEDLATEPHGRHMSGLIREASACLRIFEWALEGVVFDDEDSYDSGHCPHCGVSLDWQNRQDQQAVGVCSVHGVVRPFHQVANEG